MQPKTYAVSLVIAIVLIVSFTANADQVIEDDSIIQGTGDVDGSGAMCVGNDCVNGEAFDGDSLRLKENNLRIRFFNHLDPEELIQSWAVSANSSRNSGRSYFNMEFTSEDTFLISDGLYLLSNGTAPLYDCDLDETVSGFPSVIGVIAEGEPIIQPYLQTGITYICGLVPVYPLYDCTQTNPLSPAPRVSIPAGEIVFEPIFNTDTGVFDCINVVADTPVFQLGTAVEDGVALGYDSDFEEDVVSLGKTDLVRQIKHVAEGLVATDLLITRTLNDYTPYAEQREQLTDLSQQLASLDEQLDDIEAVIAAAENEAPSAPVLISPADGATGLDPNAVTFTWRRADDADDDPLSYSITYCEDPTFIDCSPIDVAATYKDILFATLGGGAGIFALGFIAPALRRKKPLLYTASMAAIVIILTACGGGSSGQSNLSTTVTGLASNTTYQWKVTVTDGNKSTDSAVRSFTTR